MGHGGTRNPPHIPKGCVSETLHLKLRAPQLYPDPYYTDSSKGSRSSRCDIVELHI
jgi:hypothetical protein